MWDTWYKKSPLPYFPKKRWHYLGLFPAVALVAATLGDPVLEYLLGDFATGYSAIITLAALTVAAVFTRPYPIECPPYQQRKPRDRAYFINGVGLVFGILVLWVGLTLLCSMSGDFRWVALPYNFLLICLLLCLLYNAVPDREVHGRSLQRPFILWGGQYAGKTVLLASMVMSVYRDEAWDTGHTESADEIFKLYQALKDGTWPESTRADRLCIPEIMIARRDAASAYLGTKTVTLSLCDPAGQFFEFDYDGSHDHEKQLAAMQEQAFQYMANSAGILLALDVSRPDGERKRDFDTVLKNMQRIFRNRKLPLRIPLAICLTKTDLRCGSYESESALKDGKRVFNDTFGPEGLKEIETCFKKVKVFSTSVVGVRSVERNGLTVLEPCLTYRDGRAYPDGDDLRPYGGAEALVWIVDNQAGS